ncbi:MAG TPA: hypothetical protein DEH25_06805 [Chloroflexi bacterium]|nr:hypothetical protein [Chloroflexota bacterium]HBY09373.1 hypothetical protein [Chloroflexota bacterium]
MEELIKLVSQKAGISDDQAKKAVDTVVGFLKDKLPGPAAAQLDALLKGGDASNLMGGLGGLLGKK